MPQMLFYERPVALNRERHQGIRLAVTQDHFKFARRTNAVPIASTEFIDAARDYPIVFIGEPGSPMNVAALVGIRQNENLMIGADGQWASGTYIPAFARRYPFVLARTEQQDQLTVCIDEVYPGLSTEQGDALFESGGEETPYLKGILDFLQRFHAESRRTSAFAERLRELGLLEQKVIQIERNGEQQTLQGVWMVDAQRYRHLDDARVVELFRQGYVEWIEAHLLSLGSLSRLVSRLDTAAGQVGEPAAAPEAGGATGAEPARPADEPPLGTVKH